LQAGCFIAVTDFLLYADELPKCVKHGMIWFILLSTFQMLVNDLFNT